MTTDSSDAQRRALDTFLADIERRAFVFARMQLGDPDDALDMVQDAMIRLVRNYADRPQEEWKPLFYRILRNRIIDLQRRNGFRRRFAAWLPSGDQQEGPLEKAAARPIEQPEQQLHLRISLQRLQQALHELPPRQQEAVLLRAVDGLNVAETAMAMRCSEGSVKTHYSRAVHKLRARLGDDWSEHDHDE